MPSRQTGKLKHALILLATVFAGTAGAQPFSNPQVKTYGEDPNFKKTLETSKALSASPAFAPKTVTGESVDAFYRSPVVWIAAAFILLSTGAWIYIKVTSTTDPHALAATDPWIQERIAQSQANAARVEEERAQRRESK